MRARRQAESKNPLSHAHYPAWIGPPQGRRRTPFFPAIRRHLSSRQASAAPEKIAPGIAARAAASRSLTRPDPCRAPLLSFEDQEVKMTVQQHIDELRAELEWNDDLMEIRQIKAELEAALAERDRQERGE